MMLKEMLEKKYDDLIKATALRGHLIPIEEGYADALNEIYIDMGFGRLLGSRKNREGRT